MEDIKNIYTLLIHSNGLKIREIASTLNLDKNYVSELLFSIENEKYWIQDFYSKWFAKEGALQIEEPKNETSIFESLPEVKEFDISKYLTSNCSRSQAYYLHSIVNYPRVNDDETRELIRLHREGSRMALDILVKSKQRLIVYVAHMYRHRGVPFEDLIQEGNRGLLRSIEKYDMNSNYCYEEYAKAWIMQAMALSTQTFPYIVHYPANILFNHRKIMREVDRFMQKHEYFPSSCDIEIENINFERIAMFLGMPYNLQNAVKHMGNSYDELPNSSEADVLFYHEDQKHLVNVLLSKISRRERDILKRVYAIDTEQEESLYLIAEDYGLTRERVRQIRERTIEKLRIILGLQKGETQEQKTELPLTPRKELGNDDCDPYIRTMVQEVIKRENHRNKVDSFGTPHKKRFFYDDPDR